MDFGKEYYEFCIKNGFDMKSKGEWQKRYVNYIMSVFSDMKNKKCLDFGSAMGSMTSAFVDAGVDMVGVDVSDFYIKECPFKNLSGKLFSYTDKLPFEDQSFDFIHASQVIEHLTIEKLEVVLNEFRRILKPSGVIYFSTCGDVFEESEGADPTHIVGNAKELWYNIFNKLNFQVINDMYDKTWENQSMYREYKWKQHVIIPIAIPVQEVKLPEVQVSVDPTSEIPGEVLSTPEPIVQKSYRKKGRK